MSNQGVNWHGIEKIMGEPYLKFTSRNNQLTNHSYMPFTLNNTSSQIMLKPAAYDAFVPGGYFNTIKSHFQQLYTNDGKAIVYQYADSLYDFETKKMISIPLPQPTDGTTVSYEIISMCTNHITGHYHLYYRLNDSNQYHLLIMDKKGELISVEDQPTNYGRLISPYQLLYFLGAKKSFLLVDL